MFCTYCGHEIPQGANFCPTCGRPIYNQSSEDQPNYNNQGQPSHNSQEPSSRGGYEQARQGSYGASNYSAHGPSSHGSYGQARQGRYGQPNYGPQQPWYPYPYPIYEWQLGPWVGSLDIWSVFRESMTNKFNDISGRMTRAEYFRFILVIMTLSILVEVGAILTESDSIVDIVYYAMLFIFTVPVLSAGIRRLHDSGMSGLWILLEIPSRLINFLIGPNDVGNFLLPYVIVAEVLSFIFLFLCLRKSQRFTNQYGPLPDYTYYVKGN